MYPPTVKDILTFHQIDRAVYEKFVWHGTEPGTARKITAFFMWVDQFGYDIIGRITRITSPSLMFALIAEADAVMRCLCEGDDLNNYTETPLITLMTANNIDMRIFNFRKDAIVRGLASTLDGVGRFIFDDHMTELFRAYEMQVAAARATLGAVMPAIPFELAMPYNPDAAVPSADEDARTMLITFLDGFPIEEEEILEHFSERWGHSCIERVRVMVEHTPAGQAPLGGLIVFRSDTYRLFVQIITYP